MDAYKPSLVANAFLYKAKQLGAPLTHMKLQKLVFFMHAWSLAFDGKSVVAERPEAWQYGPVFETLYHSLKANGSKQVSDYLTMLNPATGELQALIPNVNDKHLWNLLEQVWDRYGGFSAMQLSALTHEAGSPWDVARQAQRTSLDDGAIASFYRSKIGTAQNAG